MFKFVYERKKEREEVTLILLIEVSRNKNYIKYSLQFASPVKIRTITRFYSNFVAK